jgi:sensor c-di-GMP phosphodiesterase-like protein
LLYPKRTSFKLMAAVLGIIVTGVPMILFNAWLKKQGDDEVAILASWALRSAEIQIEQTVAALEGLSARGVNSCRPAHLEAMRKAALLAAPVKEVLLIGPNSQIR